MRRLVALALTVLVGSGCSTVVRWEKPGGSEADRQRDETDCTGLASRETTVPTAQSAGTGYGTPTDSQRSRIRTYDASAFEECMKGRGYQRIAPLPPA
jgi:hypothetical protein